jgi:hypothetical protein
MNLLIGLLNNAIEEDNNRVSYLMQKAEVNNNIINYSISVNILIYLDFYFLKILAEIELFYLLPHQRRWKTWFPKVMYVILLLKKNFVMILLIIRFYYSRHYYADTDKTREEIKRLIKEGEWDTKEFTEMRKNLFEVLRIEHKLDDNEVILKKLKTHDEKLDKLDKLEKLEEKLEKLLEEKHAK